MYRKSIYILFMIFFIFASSVYAGQSKLPTDSLFSSLKYRLMGPFRGGRSAAVCGAPQDPMTFYFGATGGGVWKTSNGGQSWKNISDGFFGGSIGAIAVSAWDPNVIYVGGGEETLRGNVSHGNGMWKSMDGGKTWRQSGLKDSRHIARIRVHPRNPDIVYVAALGHLFGPNKQRGIFRSKDGGKSWKKILYVDQNSGAVDLVMDPNNPRILFAAIWQVRRTPYSFSSGGPGSSIWKSIDGGDTWKNITHNKGLPKGIIGISGLSISAANSERVYAIIEARDGGVFRSENSGQSWHRVNDERKLRQRAWYFSRIMADPQNADMLYVLNVRLWRSKDGGKTYEQIRTPHGDHHDLWIDPQDPARMIVGDDGGAQISYNRGASWSGYHNQPTAQFYRVATDNHFPYRVYGGQQDNSSIRLLHRSDGWGLSEDDWQASAGGESGWLAPDPKNPEIVYGGSYDGLLSRYNHTSGAQRIVDVWPDNAMGHAAGDLKYRFQWNFPILFSPNDPHTLYAAGNVLFKTTNQGQSWQAISPDLTRNDSTKLGASGGPITRDNTSVEYYGTIFTVAESPGQKGLIWTGSDDGLIYLTRDGGKSWKNVTPSKKLLPEWSQINSIEIDPFHKGGLYVAATRYKSDDFHPYLYHTTNYGKSWKKIVSGISDDHFTRVIRADDKKNGLLFAGTEQGIYFSFDDGAHWRRLQLNLPIVPVTDIALKANDLLVATQGRSFWSLDNYAPLRFLDKNSKRLFSLLPPEKSYRLSGRGSRASLTRGGNPPNGVVIDYLLLAKIDSAATTLKILDNNGVLIKEFSPGDKKNRLPAKIGHNRFVWNMRYPDGKRFDGMIMWFGSTRGPKVVPGSYRVRLISGQDSTEQTFQILMDPRSKSTVSDLQEQFDFLTENNKKMNELVESIIKIRAVRGQINGFLGRLTPGVNGADTLRTRGKKLVSQLTSVEETLYQTKNRSPQDPLNFPTRLATKLATLTSMMSGGDFKPTNQAYAVRAELLKKIEPQLQAAKKLLSSELNNFNALVAAQAIPAIIVNDKP